VREGEEGKRRKRGRRKGKQAPNPFPDEGTADSPLPSVATMLMQSMMNLPDSLEPEKPRHYKPKNPYNTPPVFPNTATAFFDDSGMFERLDTDTLFFIFYYQQGMWEGKWKMREGRAEGWRSGVGTRTKRGMKDRVTEGQREGKEVIGMIGTRRDKR
jgi:hypothetical protein